MLAGAVPKVRQASASARIAAHGLLREFGRPAASILRDHDGVPLWPSGLVGSLAHDDQVAVAALASAAEVAGLGIDVEPCEPLPARLLDLVATPCERREIGDDPVAARLVFCVKEAVYKACFPLDRVFLDFQDVELRLRAGEAHTKTGRVVRVVASARPRLVAIALVRR